MAVATVANVVLLVIGVAVGFAAGRLQRPRGAHSPVLRVRNLAILGLGTIAGGAAQMLDGDSASIVLAGSLALLMYFAGSNLHLTGMAVVGLGLLTNLVGVVANGSVTVRGDALVAVGLLEHGDLATTQMLGARRLETPGDRLGILGDVIPVSTPIVPDVVSFGDLIVVVGAADALRELSRRRRRAWTSTQRRAHQAREDRLQSLGAPEPSHSAPADWVIDLTDGASSDREAPVVVGASPPS